MSNPINTTKINYEPKYTQNMPYYIWERVKAEMHDYLNEAQESTCFVDGIHIAGWEHCRQEVNRFFDEMLEHCMDVDTAEEAEDRLGGSSE